MNTELTIVNARISSTQFGINDHGIMDFWIFLDWQGGGQGIGRFCLDGPNPDKEKNDRIGWGPAITAIRKILEVVGVTKWEDMKGQLVRAKIVNRLGSSVSPIIGNILNDEWFDVRDFFQKAQEEEQK